MPRYNPYKVTKHPRQKQNLFLRNTPPRRKPQNPAIKTHRAHQPQTTKHKTHQPPTTTLTNHKPQHKASKAKSIPTINAPSPQRNQPQHPLIRLAAQNTVPTQPKHPLPHSETNHSTLSSASPHKTVPTQPKHPHPFSEANHSTLSSASLHKIQSQGRFPHSEAYHSTLSSASRKLPRIP